MLRVILWELKKIVESKLLWGVIILGILFIILQPAPDAYYRRELKIYDMYQGPLTNYNEDITTHYNELKSSCEKDKYDVKTCYDFEIYQQLYNAIMYQNKMKNIIENNIHGLESSRVKENKFGNIIIDYKIELLNEVKKTNVSYADNSIFLKQYFDSLAKVNLLFLVSLTLGIFPLFIKENHDKMHPLIGVTKHGRRIFFSKFLAGLCFSSLLFMLFNSLHFYKYGLLNGALYYMNHPMYDLNNLHYISWMKLNFKEFFMLIYLCLFGLSIIITSFLIAISKIAKHYVPGMVFSITYFLVPIAFLFFRAYQKSLVDYLITYLHPAMANLITPNLITTNLDSTFAFHYKYWVRDVYTFNILVLLVIFTYLIYYYFKKEDIN